MVLALCKRLSHLSLAMARVVAGATVVVAVLAAPAAAAEVYPTRPIRMVVPFAAGGITDIVARTVTPRMSEGLGRTIVIDNRGGAGGTIGADIVAKARPDGYTLVMATISTHAVGPSVYKKLPYDPQRDFAPISIVATAPNVIVTYGGFSGKSIKDLVDAARSQPGKFSYGTSGPGSWNHLGGVMLNKMAGIDMIHVPYKGVAAGYPDLLAGRVHILFDSLIPTIPYIKSGQMRALAVLDPKRARIMPDIPTMVESGYPAFQVMQWVGVLAPAGTPANVIARWHTEVVKALKHEDVQTQLTLRGAETVGNTPAEFARIIRADLERYGKAARDAGVSLEL
jgi:tripartite-type tricarboxylate transporter receptor subunit TctC